MGDKINRIKEIELLKGDKRVIKSIEFRKLSLRRVIKG